MSMSRSVSPKILSTVVLMLVLALPVAAQKRGGGQGQRGRPGVGTGNPDQELPPWLYVESGTTPPITSPLVLYWLPATPEEIARSPLLGSRALLEDSGSCLALEVIVPPNQPMVDKLGVAGKLPVVVLVDRQGHVVRRVDNAGGVLRLPAVEQMVRAELDARNEAMYRDITEAKRLAGAGDTQGAINLYRRIWDDRCLYPLAGKQAQSALHALGVVVVDVPVPPPVDPSLATPSLATSPPATPPPAKPKTDHPSTEPSKPPDGSAG